MNYDEDLWMLPTLQEVVRQGGLVVEGDETVDELTEAMLYLAESIARG